VGWALKFNGPGRNFESKTFRSPANFDLALEKWQKYIQKNLKKIPNILIDV